MKGILFKEEMFRAVLDGSKTQTRRLVTKEKKWNISKIWNLNGVWFSIVDTPYNGTIAFTELHDGVGGPCKRFKPRYNVGEIVFLKEPYCDDLRMEKTFYKFDDEDRALLEKMVPEIKNPYKNKLFMPECEARYFIKFSDVRVERVNEISEADAKAEGVILNEAVKVSSYVYWFEKLWIFINGKDSWAENPWVWIYELELTTKLK